MLNPKVQRPTSKKKKLTDGLPSTRPYLIDHILPAHEVHLIGGASGAGKSRLWLQSIEKWREGEPVFGYASHPVPFVYVTSDRSYASVCETIRDLGIDPTTIPIFPALELEPPQQGYTMSWLLGKIKEHHPEAKLYIIEALGTFVPGGKIADYNVVSKFLRDITRHCIKHKVTVVGMHHTAKEKEKGGYAYDREKLMGSGGWSGFSETIIFVQHAAANEPKSPYRRIHIMPRNGASLIFNFKFDKVGRLQEMSKAEAAFVGMEGTARRSSVQKALRRYFEHCATPNFKLREILDATPEVSRRTIIRQIEEWVESGTLRKLGHGSYAITGREATQIFEGTLL